jgi:hypothetical protein
VNQSESIVFSDFWVSAVPVVCQISTGNSPQNRYFHAFQRARANMRPTALNCSHSCAEIYRFRNSRRPSEVNDLFPFADQTGNYYIRGHERVSDTNPTNEPIPSGLPVSRVQSSGRRRVTGRTHPAMAPAPSYFPSPPRAAWPADPVPTSNPCGGGRASGNRGRTRASASAGCLPEPG